MTSAPDSFQIIATTLATLYGTMAFGDTDHDGSGEIALAVSTIEEFSYRVLEYNKADRMYSQELVGPDMTPFALGDLDHDGNSEALGQLGANLLLYESAGPDSHPTVLVWQSPAMTNIIGYSTLGDTDRDGNMEIIHSINSRGSRLAIFENTGDNAFALKLDVKVDRFQETGPKLIADLDQDGLLEIAFGGTNGNLHVFESPADDVWQEVFVASTGMVNAYGVTGGVDSDWNGKPELFIAGDSIDGRLTCVYEAAGDNVFVKVAAIHTDDFVTGFTPNCMSNTDGVGQPEYVWRINHQIRAYHGAAPGQWTLSTSANDPDANGMHTAIAAYDINQNGRDEIYWATQGNAIYGNTLVLERPPPSPADTDTWAPLGAVTARVRPTPCRAHATLRLADPKLQRAAFSIAAYDVSGRLVLRERMRFSSSSDIDVPIRALRPGWYVLRVEDRVGQPVAIARTVIVR